MPTNTYVELTTETVATATPSVTLNLSGISGYTDLVMIVNGGLTTNNQSFRWQFNGDTANNYSYTYIAGNGSSASSNRASNASGINAYHVSGQSDSGLKSNVIFYLQNYANTTTFKTCLIRGNTDLETAATVGLWRNTAGVTSILVTTTNGNIQAGTTISLYGVAAENVPAYATGGTIYQDSTSIYHVFGSSGSFVPNRSLSCEVFLVGGGAGGRYNFGGGGGGGQVRTISNVSFSATSHTVTVGAGGAGDTSGVGNPGTSSSAGGNSAVGGSAGIAGGGGTPPAGGTSGNGFAGGAGINTNNNNLGGGGGGGASAVGLNAGDADFGPVGGDGIAYVIAGDTKFYGGGGNGGISGYGFNGGWGANTLSYPLRTSRGGGGLGGGGGVFIPQIGNGLPGAINSGGGGGGGNWDNSGAGFFGGNGGSGIVVIKYAK